MRTGRHQMPAWRVSWSEQVWTGLQWWKPARGGSLPHVGGGEVLYSEAQCIMGNGHMVHSHPVDRQALNSENITFPQRRWRAVIISKRSTA